MTDSPTDDPLRAAATSLAAVLDLEADELRGDSPLDDLGADAAARIQWADLVEEQTLAVGRPLVVDDATLRTARTLGDLAAGLHAPVVTP